MLSSEHHEQYWYDDEIIHDIIKLSPSHVNNAYFMQNIT